MKNITDVMTKRTEDIYYAKKAAIESGDKDLLHALGEGKDIMSVLCEFTIIYAIFRPSYAYGGFDSEGEHEGS